MRYLLPLLLALVATPAPAKDAGVVTAKDWEDALGFTATEQVVVVLEDVLEIEHKVEEDVEHLVEETDDLNEATSELVLKMDTAKQHTFYLEILYVLSLLTFLYLLWRMARK